MKVRGDSLYIQTTLPPKPGSASSSPSRQVISTGLKDTVAGRKEFQRLVRKLEDQLDRGTFDWREWGWVAQHLTRDEAIAQLKAKKLPEVTFEAWYNWELMFKRLPEGTVTAEKLRQTLISSWAVDSAVYWRACMAFRALGQIALGESFTLDVPSPGYSPSRVQKRDIPSDGVIEEAVDALDEPFRWMAGMVATFGLRPHELFHSTLQDGVVEVGEDTKTGARIVYPVPKEWWERWGLEERRWPSEWNALLTDDGREQWYRTRVKRKRPGSFESIGNSHWTRMVIRRLSWRKFPLTLYTLRHAYALRCMRSGVPTAIAAKMMGHGEQMHINTYRKWLSTEMVRDFMENLQ